MQQIASEDHRRRPETEPVSSALLPMARVSSVSGSVRRTESPPLPRRDRNTIDVARSSR
jgi:hypothetical protein